MGDSGFPQDPRGPRPHSGGQRGRVRGRSQALEECELPGRRKEGTGCEPGPPLGLGKAANCRAGSGVGARRGCSGPGAAGGSGRAVGSATRLGGGPPRLGGWEPGGHAAGRAAGAPRDSGWAGSPARKLRREPEPERSQSSDIRAPANTCERPPGPAGGARSPGRGRAGGRGHGARLGPARGHVAEAPPPPACGPPSVQTGSLLAGRGAGSGDPEQHLRGRERQEVLGCSLGPGEGWWL